MVFLDEFEIDEFKELNEIIPEYGVTREALRELEYFGEIENITEEDTHDYFNIVY